MVHKNELVKREIVFQPCDNGGLALVNMHNKSQALLLGSLSQIVDFEATAKWIFLARYWIARSLSKYATLWSFLRSNLLPNSLYRPALYDTLLSLVNRFRPQIDSLIENRFAVRNCYRLILESSVVEPRSQVLWRFLCPSRTLPWKTIWNTSMNNVLSTGYENDVAWKITHRVLKTLDYIKTWGCKTDGLCKRCPKRPETIEHIFLRVSYRNRNMDSF